MGLPKQRGGLPVLPTRSRQLELGARQTPRLPQDSDGPVPVRGVRAFPIGPDREGRGEARMGLPKQRGGLPVLLSGPRQLKGPLLSARWGNTRRPARGAMPEAAHPAAVPGASSLTE